VLRLGKVRAMSLHPTQKSPDHESGPCDLPNQKQTSEVSGDAEMHEPVDDEPEITEADFFYALAARDLKQAAAVLRSLGGFGPKATEILADLLEGNPKQEEWFQKWFPYCFVLRRWRPGKPANPFKHGLGEAMLRNKITEKLKIEKKVHLAIAAVAKETNLSPSTLWSVWSYKNKTPPNS
jgi:hypothetical protein